MYVDMRFLLLYPSILSAALAIIVSGTIPAPETLAILHPSTRVTLQDIKHSYTSLVTESGHFTFTDVEDRNASYSLSVASLSHAFNHYRIDVDVDANPPVAAYKRPTGTKFSDAGPRVPYPLVLTAVSCKDYYTPRPSVQIVTLLKSPMVWLGLVMVFSIFVLPKVTEWVDPEGVQEMQQIRARKAEEQKNQPKSDVANSVEQLQNFDVSGWLAGKR